MLNFLFLVLSKSDNNSNLSNEPPTKSSSNEKIVNNIPLATCLFVSNQPGESENSELVFYKLQIYFINIFIDCWNGSKTSCIITKSN